MHKNHHVSGLNIFWGKSGSHFQQSFLAASPVVAHQEPADPYWKQVRYLFLQMWGLKARVFGTVVSRGEDSGKSSSTHHKPPYTYKLSLAQLRWLFFGSPWRGRMPTIWWPKRRIGKSLGSLMEGSSQSVCTSDWKYQCKAIWLDV